MSLKPFYRRILACAVAGIGTGLLPDRASAEPRPKPAEGIVFYLDGAGGGGLLLNWGRRVREGLEDGGFRGEFEDHGWQTGLGPLVDHAMSEGAKRRSARKLADEITEYMERRPGHPVHLIGLSAGTSVLVYTLEELPRGRQVDTAILLNSSMDAGYDLTRALQHVHGNLYLFASRHDPLLNTLIPMVGTADREFTIGDVAGLRGFHIPPNAGPQTRSLYAKVVNVPWRGNFAQYGNFGSHTGTTNPEFVARVITPLLKSSASTQAAVSPRGARSPAQGFDRGRAGR